MNFKGSLFAVFIGLGLQSGSVNAEEYVVALNHAPPYRIIETSDGGKRFSGFYVDFIREVARRLKFSLKFKEVPFRRALALMERGTADIMVGPNRTAEREKYMLYLDEKLSREAKSFYVRPDAPDIVSYDGLASKRIGVLRGSIYFDRFDQDARLTKEPVAHYSTALKMLSGHRLEVVIAPEQLADYLVRQLNLDLKKVSFRSPGRPSYIAISRKSSLAKLKIKLESALRNMKADGTIDLLIKSYR